MRKYFTVLLLFFIQLIAAQNPEQKITISFEESTYPEVLSQLEEQTDFQFFFLEEWFEEKTISGSYKNKELNFVLNEIFEKTNINFLMLDHRVILTRGNLIFNTLPENFLNEGLGQELVPEKQSKPVFYSNNSSKISQPIKTVIIGKEDIKDTQEIFSVSGRVTNSNGEPIAGLNVIVKDENKGSITNTQGYFELKLPKGEYIIETQALGVEKFLKRLIVYNNGFLNFTLNEGFEELEEVLIDSKATENIRSGISGVERIEVAKIKTIPLVLGERDILKVAATLPGISTAGEAASGYNVRGGKTDQNLILLDGGVIYNPLHFFGIFSGLNPFTTGEVEIYKGSIPAEFGGRLSSVFDIKTKSGNNLEFAGEASVGPVTSNLSLEIPVVKGKSSLIIGGRSTYSDWILNLLDEESLKNSKASFYDFVAKYNHKITSSSEINATAYYSSDLFSITSDSLFNYKNRLLALSYQNRLNDRNSAEISVTNSRYNFNIIYESEFNDNFESSYFIDESNFKLKLQHLLNEKHNFNYGINGKYYTVMPGQLRPLGSGSFVENIEFPKERGIESGVFIEDNFNVNEKLLLVAGFRYSWFAALGPGVVYSYQPGTPRDEKTIIDSQIKGKGDIIETYGGPEVRLSARYFILPGLSTKIGYNSTYQYIHTLSNNTTASPTDTYKLSNKHIKPQKADQYSLGLYKNFNNNLYEASIESYYKKSENILDYKVGANLFLNEYLETEILQGEGKAYGVEFLLRKREGRLNGYLGYTYSRSFIKLDSEFREETVNDGKFFPTNFDKPHDFSLVGNYKLTERFSFSANFVYQTGRPITFPVGKYNFNNSEFVLYSDRNKYRIPDYYRLDLSFNVEGNHRIEKLVHSFWNISVYNVLGRNNPYSVFFVTDEGEVKAYQNSIFAVPIPTITYNIKF